MKLIKMKMREIFKMMFLCFILSVFAFVAYLVIDFLIENRTTFFSANGENFFTNIDYNDIPDEFTSNNNYYYQNDTYVIYMSYISDSSRFFIKLESADYDKYVYDVENKEFIGVKGD